MKQMYHYILFWTKGTPHYSPQSMNTNQVTYHYCHNTVRPRIRIIKLQTG